MELIFGSLVMALVVLKVPGVLAEMYEAYKAAQASNWQHLDGMRASREARAQRIAGMADRILARRAADAAGIPRRPGLGTWVGDVWHGAWEDALSKRAAKRDARQPYDPARPGFWSRFDRKLRAGVVKWQARRNPAGQMCLWPIHDDGGGPVTYCGASAVAGDIYCPPHCEQDDAENGLHTLNDSDTAGPDDTNRPHSNHIPTPESPPTTTGEPTMTPPTTVTAGADFADVQTNEAARRGLNQIKGGAARLAEAAAMAERARAEIAAGAQALGDGMAAARFDAGATQAVANINDIVGNATLNDWSAAADEISGAADTGLRSLEKFRDAEDVVANNNVDGRTLEPTAS